MADSWTRPFDASYDFVRVSRETVIPASDD